MARYKEEARIVIDADGAAYRKEMSNLRKVTKRETESMRKSFMGLAAIGTGLALLTKHAAEYEAGLSGIEKTTGITGVQLEKFGNRLRKLSQNTAFSTRELQSIAQAAGQLGISGAANLEKYTEVVAKLGSASDLAGDAAAFALSRFSAAAGVANEDVDRLASAIVALGNGYATLESELVNTSQTVAANVASFGVSAEAMLGIGTALNAIGQGGEVGGTALSKFFSILTEGATEGGEKLDKLSTIMQMSGEDIQRLFAEDIDQALVVFARGLSRYGVGMDKVLGDLGISEVRAKRILKSLADNHVLLDSAIKDSSEAFAANVALAKEYGTQMDNLKNQAKILAGRISELGLALGLKLVPSARKAVDSMNDLLGNEENQKSIIEIIALVIKLGTAFLAAKVAISALKIGIVAWKAVFLTGGWLAAVTKSIYGMATAQHVLTAAAHASTLAAGLGKIAWKAMWGAATLGLTYLIFDYGPKLIKWMMKTEGVLDWLGGAWRVFWGNIQIAGLQTLKLLTVGIGGWIAAIADTLTFFQFDFLGVVSATFQELDGKIDGLRANIQGAKDDMDDAVLAFKRSQQEIAQSQFGGVGSGGLAGGGRRFYNRQVAAGQVDEGGDGDTGDTTTTTTDGVTTPNYFATQFSRLEQSGLQLNRLDKKLADERLRNQEDAAKEAARIEAEKNTALEQMQLEHEAHVLSKEEEQASKLAEIERHKLATQEMLEQMYREGAKERDIQQFEEDRELKMERMEAELLEDQAAKDLELARLDAHEARLQAIRDKYAKLEKEKEKKQQMDALKYMADRYSGAAGILKAYHRWQALQALTRLPGQAAESAATTAKSVPWPANIPLVAGAIAQVLGQAAAIREGLRGNAAPDFFAMNKGGLVPGTSFGNVDSQMVYATPGEFMFPKQNYAAAKAGMRQEILAELRDERGESSMDVDVNIGFNRNTGRLIQAEYDAAEATRA